VEERLQNSFDVSEVVKLAPILPGKSKFNSLYILTTVGTGHSTTVVIIPNGQKLKQYLHFLKKVINVGII